MSLLIFPSWGLDKLESADQYQAHSCLGLLENKPQINADERRLIESDEETCLSIFSSIIVEFFENVILLKVSDTRRLIHKSNREFADRYRAHSCPGLLKNKPQINADERRLIKTDEETCFLNSNSILIPHIFTMTYSSHNHCL